MRSLVPNRGLLLAVLVLALIGSQTVTAGHFHQDGDGTACALCLHAHQSDTPLPPTLPSAAVARRFVSLPPPLACLTRSVAVRPYAVRAPPVS